MSLQTSDLGLLEMRCNARAAATANASYKPITRIQQTINDTLARFAEAFLIALCRSVVHSSLRISRDLLAGLSRIPTIGWPMLCGQDWRWSGGEPVSHYVGLGFPDRLSAIAKTDRQGVHKADS
jgi:hypothetical protein